jgi:hypothetical protein
VIPKSEIKIQKFVLIPHELFNSLSQITEFVKMELGAGSEIEDVGMSNLE